MALHSISGCRLLDRKSEENRPTPSSGRAKARLSLSGADRGHVGTLPRSALPDELRAAGYDLRPADPPEGRRILANAITQTLTLTSCGVFEEMTEGSTKPVAEIRTHAGIVCVLRYAFALLL